MPDPYLIPGTVVLQNKLGISDFDELEQAVAFREGNGRSQKVFFSLVCRPRGLQLNWSEIPSNEHNLAAQQAMRGDISLLRKHFQSIVAKSASPSLALRKRGSSD